MQRLKLDKIKNLISDIEILNENLVSVEKRFVSCKKDLLKIEDSIVELKVKLLKKQEELQRYSLSRVDKSKTDRSKEIEDFKVKMPDLLEKLPTNLR